MNAVFLLPFVIVASLGIYQDATALYSFRGYDYQTVENQDGTYSTTFGLEPWIFDGQKYIPYTYSNNTVTTVRHTVELLPDGKYNFDDKFTDHILVKYADVTDPNNWTYPNTLNNDSPDRLFSDGEFSSIRYKAGIGLVNYQYVYNDGKWKTQLIATNLSGLSTKLFGFDEIIDINSDRIKFGGVTRNLDNFDGQTFTKSFLDENQGKVIDLLTGQYFDFGLGYENLYSITIFDTGPNKTRLIFDYRTDTPLLPNETLIIDPTIGPTQSTTERTAELASTTGAACSSSGSQIQDGYYQLFKDADVNNGSCFAAGIDFDISALPSYAIITDTVITYDIDNVASALSCTYRAMSATAASYPNTATGALNLFNDATSGTAFVSGDTGCNTTGLNKTLDLGTSADSDLEDHIASGTWSLGMGFSSYTRDATTYNTYGGFVSNGMELTVTYTVPPPDAVTDLTTLSNTASSVLFSWSAPDTGAPTQSIIGYQLNITNPCTSDPTDVFVNHTGSTDTTYNATSGFTVGNCYSARITAWTNNTGGHPFSNATGNVVHIPFWTPAVTDLTAESNIGLSVVDLDWTAPDSFATITGYMVNFTTPFGDPTSVVSPDTGSTDTSAQVIDLTIGNDYSFRVSPVTNLGTNDTGNIANATVETQFVIGNLSSLDVTNEDDFKIFFSRTDISADSTYVNVTYPDTYNLQCSMYYEFARVNNTYGNFTATPVDADNEMVSFHFINATGDIITIRCTDLTTGDSSNYVLTIQDFPFLQQISDLRNGTYGTYFEIGAIDGVTLLVIFIGMIGFNRTNPIAGIIFIIIAIVGLSYFDIITYPVIMYPALVLMGVWAFISTRKDD